MQLPILSVEIPVPAKNHVTKPMELPLMEPPPEISTTNTIMPRHLAAIFDNMFAPLLGLIAAKTIDEEHYQIQFVLFACVYLGYFLLFEYLFSRTPGKMLTGLVIVRKDGSRISISDAAIRTILRVIEVNPALLGYAPAAISIIFSKHHQRMGDRIAGTIVVPPDRIG
jgi:uncharacterized RDD family membrane protein YckC